MRKNIIRLFSLVLLLSILLSTLLLLPWKRVPTYQIEVPTNEVYNQYNTFDPYEFKAYNNQGTDVSEYVNVYNLELLNLRNNRITEFGTFNLRYELTIEGYLECYTYRTIKVIYKEDKKNGYILNSDFYAKFKSWNLVDWKSNVDLNFDNDYLEINQKSVDEFIWDQSIYQYVSDLEIGKTYKIVFEAKSSNPKTVKVCLAQTFETYPWSYNIMDENDIEITNNFNTYEIIFTAKNPINLEEGFDFNINQVRLEFKFGKYDSLNNTKSTISFKNINIFYIN